MPVLIEQYRIQFLRLHINVDHDHEETHKYRGQKMRHDRLSLFHLAVPFPAAGGLKNVVANAVSDRPGIARAVIFTCVTSWREPGATNI
jgi:hypothetical protein